MSSLKSHPAPRFVELASVISDAVAKLECILSDQGAPWPSFDEDAPASLPEDATDAQEALLDATAELYDLVSDPLALILRVSSRHNVASLQAISRFHIASKVPSNGLISYKELAPKAGVDEPMLRRLLRHAMTLRIFREPRPGMVAHTQASKLLARSDVNSFMAYHPEIGWPTAAKTLDALEKWPNSEEPDQTAFSLADNEGGSIYDAFGRDQQRALRFAAGMQVFGALPRFNMSSAVNGFDWESLGQANVVDVGGSRGHLAVALAQRFPRLTFVVQDMEKVVEEGRDTLAPELHGRIKFMAHDFFKPMEVSADAYLLRTILHNWSDKYCVAILRALVPALKPGAKILINEICLPEPGSMPAHLEAELRLMDLSMGSVFNGKERDPSEWKGLLTRADSRFVLRNIVKPSGSSLAMIEIDWCADS